MRRFKNIKSYIKDVTELIWNYIRHKNYYPQHALLAVMPELMETVIDHPNNCKECEFYAIDQFISTDLYGRQSPNHAAIERMAGRYYHIS